MGGEDQLIGNKGTYRGYLTLKVLDSMEWMGALTTCLSLKCDNPQSTYNNFVHSFHTLYVMTSMSTNNPDILQRIEKAFYTDRNNRSWSINSQKDYIKKSWVFIDLYKEYMIQLKADGLYNPEINYGTDKTTDVWRDSIG